MMDELSLYVIDLFENSVRAGSDFVEIILIEDKSRDEILLIVKDNGKGIRNNKLGKVIDPFYTTKNKRRVGLGLSLLHQTSIHCGGDFPHTESVDFKFTYRRNGKNFIFDTREWKRILDEIPLTYPEVLRSIKGYIKEGLISLNKNF